MLRTGGTQGTFYDVDVLCNELIPADSFYRKFREIVVPIIEDKDFEKDDCIKKAMKKCLGSNYSYTGFNCCHCVEQAFKGCGTSIPVSSWPNWPINPGPQPGEAGYSPYPVYGPNLGK